jgi:hypothetical protein
LLSFANFLSDKFHSNDQYKPVSETKTNACTKDKNISTDLNNQNQSMLIIGQNDAKEERPKLENINGNVANNTPKAKVAPNKRIEIDNNGENCERISNGFLYLCFIKPQNPCDSIPQT